MYLTGLLREFNDLIQRLVNTIPGKQQILRKHRFSFSPWRFRVWRDYIELNAAGKVSLKDGSNCDRKI